MCVTECAKSEYTLYAYVIDHHSLILISSNLPYFSFFAGGQIQHKIVQLSFAGTFALSCTMFELIIFEISDTLEKS